MIKIKYPWNNKIKAIYTNVLENSPIVDCHVHLGLDENGETSSTQDIIKAMNLMKVTRSAIFPFSDPNRKDDFHDPNERIYDACKKYPDRLIPFFRLDPNKNWKKEFDLRVKQGFVGIKLHPPRQKFKIHSKNSIEIFKRASENGIVVLVHTGLGSLDLPTQLKGLLSKVPNAKIILGHAAFVDMDTVIPIVKNFPNVYFEISAIRNFDFYNLIKQVSTKRIIFGTDYPFYSSPMALELLISTALTYKKSFVAIENMLGLTFQNLLKSTKLFDKQKIKNMYIKKTKRNEPIDIYKLTKRGLKLIANIPFKPLSEFINKISSYESRKNANRIVQYLRIYTFLNSAEVLLEKDSIKRAYIRLEIIKNITKVPFDKKEEEYINLIRETVIKIIKDKKKVTKFIQATDYNKESVAKISLRIAKNICITRMLKVE